LKYDIGVGGSHPHPSAEAASEGRDMQNPVNWFEIYVQDMERAKAFYEAVLGVQLTKLEETQFEMWAFPMQQDGSGVSGSLIKMPGFSSDGNGIIIYFRCADCAVEAEKAARAGGRIETGKKSIGPYGYIALVIDTEGNMIGLHSMQ
jgi:predicted enzyme related to lactoylglutathione lyase